MKYINKKIAVLLGVSCLLFVFVAYPNMQELMNPLPYQITKDPEDPKRYDDLLARGAVPKSLLIQKKPTIVQSFGNVCSPYSNIFGVLTPLITFSYSIYLWVKKR